MFSVSLFSINKPKKKEHHNSNFKPSFHILLGVGGGVGGTVLIQGLALINFLVIRVRGRLPRWALIQGFGPPLNNYLTVIQFSNPQLKTSQSLNFACNSFYK